MTSRPNNPLKSILHPYIFVLKEGQKIKKDFLDYSLMMLFLHSRETIPSPVEESLNFAKTFEDKPKIAKKNKVKLRLPKRTKI